jgi:hypothetical protein
MFNNLDNEFQNFMKRLIGIGVLLSLITSITIALLIQHFYLSNSDEHTNELFEIVDIKPGHVVEVTFQNVSTTELYKINFIKRYCDNWASISLGSEWSLPVLVKNKDKYILNANLICGD